MRKEVELEAIAQFSLRQGGDRAGPGGAGVADHHIKPAETAAHLIEGGAHLLRIGDIAGQAQGRGAAGGRHRHRRFAIAVEHRHIGALGREGAGRSRADAAAAAGDQHHLAGQRLGSALAELGLLEAPVLHIKRVVLAHRLKAADALGRQQGAGPGLAQVGRDRGGLRRSAEADQPQTGNRHQPRQGIKATLMTTDAQVLALEVAAIGLHVSLQRLIDGAVIGIGRQHQRPGLGANDVIGGGDTAIGPVGEAGVIADGTGFGALAQIEQPVIRRAAGPGGPAKGAPQARQQTGGLQRWRW